MTKNKEFKLKILVGLAAEDKAGRIVEFAGEQCPGTTDEERRKDFLSSLRSVMRGREIDTQKYHERVKSRGRALAFVFSRRQDIFYSKTGLLLKEEGGLRSE